MIFYHYSEVGWNCGRKPHRELRCSHMTYDRLQFACGKRGARFHRLRNFKRDYLNSIPPSSQLCTILTSIVDECYTCTPDLCRHAMYCKVIVITAKVMVMIKVRVMAIEMVMVMDTWMAMIMVMVCVSIMHSNSYASTRICTSGFIPAHNSTSVHICTLPHTYTSACIYLLLRTSIHICTIVPIQHRTLGGQQLWNTSIEKSSPFPKLRDPILRQRKHATQFRPSTVPLSLSLSPHLSQEQFRFEFALATRQGPTIATLGLPQLRKPGSNGRLAQR